MYRLVLQGLQARHVGALRVWFFIGINIQLVPEIVCPTHRNQGSECLLLACPAAARLDNTVSFFSSTGTNSTYVSIGSCDTAIACREPWQPPPPPPPSAPLITSRPCGSFHGHTKTPDSTIRRNPISCIRVSPPMPTADRLLPVSEPTAYSRPMRQGLRRCQRIVSSTRDRRQSAGRVRVRHGKGSLLRLVPSGSDAGQIMTVSVTFVSVDVN